MNENWKHIEYEERDWIRSRDNAYISKTQKRKIGATYKSALPLMIKSLNVDLDRELSVMIDDVLVLMARFDAALSAGYYDFPALLLRSESAASSQIENLTSSIRNIALAEVSDKAPQNAMLIAGNVAAMRKAMAVPEDAEGLSVANILEIHKALIEPSGEDFGGQIRREQVWVGGGAYSPHGAIFVPPHQSRIPEYLEDLIEYSKRTDVNPIVKAAIVHAQFETIHPFIDGNGRTGRTLLHNILLRERVLLAVTLPVSAGLLHDVRDYMDALKEYQNGDPLPIIYQITKALELAVNIGGSVMKRVTDTLDSWEKKIIANKTSSIWKLTRLLAEHPVVDANFVSEKLEITERAARDLFLKAREYGILRRVGSGTRNVYYQADEIIAILDEVSDVKNIRRLFLSDNKPEQ